MSDLDVSLVTTTIKQEQEDPGTLPCGKQQQTDVIDDHQRKSSSRRCHTSQVATVKIAPRPANLQPAPSKEIVTARSSPCVDIPQSSLTNLFPLPSTFLPGVDDIVPNTPLPFNNHMPLPILPSPTTTTTTTTTTTMNRNNYAMPPADFADLPQGPAPHFDLSQVAMLPANHTQPDNQHSPTTPGPGNQCENDIMLKGLMSYYTQHGPPMLLRHKQPLLLTTDSTGQVGQDRPDSAQLQEKRADNRERKKRWREQNEERNKDNDLRCRVNKRAHNLFGREDNEAKRRWVENEFLKRQCRRRGKVRQMEAVDDVLSTSTLSGKSSKSSKSPKSPSPRKSASDANSGHLPILQDAYLSMLLNNMGSIPPESSLKLMEGLRLMEATIKNEADDRDHALPQQLATFLQQLQKLHASPVTPPPENPMATKAASTPPSSSTSSPSMPSSPFITTPSVLATGPPSITSPVSYTTAPMETPANKYNENPSISVPSDTTSSEESTGKRDLIAPSLSSSSSSISSSSSPQHIPSVQQDGLSAMLIQSLQQTAVSYQDKQEYTMEPLSPATTEYSRQEHSQQSVRLYSTEVIMKLMQMNLEWTKQ
ncbi:hypothetical protein BCR42DRAFT_400150 [Absidia repens]|uniref:DUF3020 domain-containing protein n=1 Tax=Absidia repens TaxID=90262 RepID=A0A1X2J0S3_9FUNG|nr:hypothetical protein BCR42DRAFT_400150 [Absidia repens]